jgi:hypothetical protein
MTTFVQDQIPVKNQEPRKGKIQVKGVTEPEMIQEKPRPVLSNNP